MAKKDPGKKQPKQRERSSPPRPHAKQPEPRRRRARGGGPGRRGDRRPGRLHARARAGARRRARRPGASRDARDPRPAGCRRAGARRASASAARLEDLAAALERTSAANRAAAATTLDRRVAALEAPPPGRAGLRRRSGGTRLSRRARVAGRRVLITGVASPLGAALARRLAADGDVAHVVGLDTGPSPPTSARRAWRSSRPTFARPPSARSSRATAVDAVVHNDLLQFPEPGRPARALHDHNVIGTLQLLAALEALPRLRTLVVRGSAAVYGSEPAARPSSPRTGRAHPAAHALPARRRRARAPRGRLRAPPPARRTSRSCASSPSSARASTRRSPASSALPVVPTVLGFDPRVQLLDAEDAVGALGRAVHHPGARGGERRRPRRRVAQRGPAPPGRRSLPVAAPLSARRRARRAARAGRRLPHETGRFLRFGRAVRHHPHAPRRCRLPAPDAPAREAAGAGPRRSWLPAARRTSGATSPASWRPPSRRSACSTTAGGG